MTTASDSLRAAHEQLRAARDRLLAARTDRERALAQFAWPDVGPRFNWAIDWFDEIAADGAGADRPALVIAEDGSRASWSFDQMRRRSNRLATWLAGLGVGRGDVAIVMLGNQVELWDAMLALMKLGAVIVPTTTALGAADLAERIARARARLVICTPQDAGKLDAAPGDLVRVATAAVSAPGTWHDLREAEQAGDAPVPHPGTAPTDPLLRYFTSGTTARPKLVEHTQVSYPVGHLTTMYWLGLQPGDVHLNISSPGWAKHAWSSFFAPWLAQATTLSLNYRRFDAAALLAVLRGEAVTTLCAPPTVWRMLIKADLGERPPTLREVVAAGEPLNPEVIRQVEAAWGLTVRDGFGQTETTASIGNTPGSPVKPGSMGRPLPGVPVVLVDPTTGAAGTDGEICLDVSATPLTLMTGYADPDPDDVPAVRGGYYHSGDLASSDEDGYITYVGRTDDVFKASDYKISPFELESVLLQHPSVAEAAVVPAPDVLRLAVPKAFVALAPGWSATRETALEILRHARTHLAPYQRVRRVEFVDLPKTISGKIRRVELREAEAAASTPNAAEWRDDAFPELKLP